MLNQSDLHLSSSEIAVEDLTVKALKIPEIKIFRAEAKRDMRGEVLPTFNHMFFEKLGLDFQVMHENHCSSPKRGTIRGFHYQLPPHGQAKLIRVCQGKIIDVNIDLRKSSSTFGQHVKVELEPDGWNQIFVPEGFAHCYCTMEPHTEVLFKLGAPYAPSFARELAWNDPDLGISWPISQKTAIVLARDIDRPAFSSLTEWFP